MNNKPKLGKGEITLLDGRKMSYETKEVVAIDLLKNITTTKDVDGNIEQSEAMSPKSTPSFEKSQIQRGEHLYPRPEQYT
jgi:hypothetical protein